jgi:spore photoproduct lyase
VHKLYPDEKLFASPLVSQQGMMSYQRELEQEMMQYCSELLLSYIPDSKFFPCTL